MGPEAEPAGKIHALLSLTIDDGEYQTEQAKAAQAAAKSLDVDLQIIFAENDSLKQSEQLLKAIQGPQELRPHLILMEPVGTAQQQVAQAAARAGIGWVLLNRTADYVPHLRLSNKLPVFSVSDDQVEIGRIQGRQMKALLPNGGTVLYLQGPATSQPAQERTTGMNATKPANVLVRMLRAKWTEESGYESVASALRLSSTGDAGIAGVFAQDDAMAKGAYRAFHTIAPKLAASVVFAGCDGLTNAGMAWVREGKLAATILMPTTADLGLKMAVSAMRGGPTPPETTSVAAISYPDLRMLEPVAAAH